jgi:hypothetical protein
MFRPGDPVTGHRLNILGRSAATDILATLQQARADDVVAAAMIDRLVHHAEVVSMKGDSYRLKDRDIGRVPAATKTND